MNLLGTVISIDLNTEAEGKNGVYPCWELIYKTMDKEVKTIVKHLNGLKYNKALANGLSQLEVGDKFTMQQEKNEGGYWEPKNVFKGHQEASAPAASSSGTQKATTRGGDWPTAEERKATQTQIVRQSSLGHAVSLVTAQGNKKATPADVIRIAQAFEAFVHGVPFDDGSIENMPNDDVEVD